MINKAVAIHNDQTRYDSIGLSKLIQQSKNQSSIHRTSRSKQGNSISHDELNNTARSKKDAEDAQNKSTLHSILDSTSKLDKSKRRDADQPKSLDELTKKCQKLVHHILEFRKSSNKQVSLIQKQLLTQENRQLDPKRSNEDMLSKMARQTRAASSFTISSRTARNTSAKSNIQTYVILEKDFRSHATFYSMFLSHFQAHVAVMTDFFVSFFKNITEYLRMVISEGVCFNFCDAQNILAYMKSVKTSRINQSEKKIFKLLMTFFTDQAGIVSEDFFKSLPYYLQLI